MKVYSYTLESKFCKPLLLFIVFSIIHSNLLQCQTLGFKWSTSLYGSGTDYCFAVVRPEGNYYFILGSTESVDLDYPADSINDERLFLSKISLDGGKEFVRIVTGFPEDSTIHPQRMIATADGGFLAIGSYRKTVPSSSQKDMILFKLDSAANLLWYKSYGGSGNEEGYDVIETLTGYIATGYSSSSDGDVNHSYGGKDVWIIETDFSGNLGWSRVSGGDENDYAASLLSNGDNVYILGTYGSAETGSLGEDDIILYNITHDGQLLFKNHYGGSNNDRGVKLLLNEYGHLVIAASTSSTNGDIVGNHLYGTLDYALLELDTNYAVINSQCFGSESGEGLLDVIIRENTYYLVGEAESSEGDIGFNYGYSDFWMCAVDSAFNLKGSFVFGGEFFEDWNDGGKSALALSDEGVFFAGYTDSFSGTVFSMLPGSYNIYYGDIKFCNVFPQIITSFPEGNNLICYGDTVVLIDTGCPGCIHIWKNWPLIFDTTSYILTTGDHGYAVKAIGECEAIAEGINILSTLPSFFINQISYTNNPDGHFNEIIQLNDSTLVGLGSSDKFYLASLTNGILDWEMSYGGTSWDDAGAIVASINDYYLCGFTYSSDGDVLDNHGFADGWIIKTDSFGNLLQSKCYGGTLYDALFDLKCLNSNRFIACGTAKSSDGDLIANYGNDDLWIMMIDSNLNVIWSKNYGGSLFDSGSNISILNSNRFMICGYSNSNDFDVSGNKGSYDVWTLMIDSTGEIIWDKTFGTTSTDKLYSRGTLANNGSQIYLSVEVGGNDGDFTSEFSESNVWMLSLDTSGNVLWKKEFAGNSSDRFCDITLNEVGDIFLTLQSFSKDGLMNVPTDFSGGAWVIIKLDSNGEINNKKFIQNDSYSNYQQRTIGLRDVIAYGLDTAIVAGYKDSAGVRYYWIEYINLSDPKITITYGNSPSCFEEPVTLSTENCNGCSILWSNGVTTQQNTVTTPGNYSVNISFTVPCFSYSDSVSLSYYPAVMPPLITQQNDTLFSSYSTNNQWYLNAVAIMGATESFVPITAFGCYQVAYTDSFGCTVFSDTLCVFGTQIQNIQQPLLNVYPNPFESVINIKGIGWEGITQIQMKDVLGRILKSETLQNNNLHFSLNWNLQQLPAGIYFIEAKGKQVTNTIRLVKN